jgi:hypothetical protein
VAERRVRASTRSARAARYGRGSGRPCPVPGALGRSPAPREQAAAMQAPVSGAARAAAPAEGRREAVAAPARVSSGQAPPAGRMRPTAVTRRRHGRASLAGRLEAEASDRARRSREQPAAPPSRRCAPQRAARSTRAPGAVTAAAGRVAARRATATTRAKPGLERQGCEESLPRCQENPRAARGPGCVVKDNGIPVFGESGKKVELKLVKG